MRKKDLYRVINEEIGEFDFLGNAAQKDEYSHERVLSSKEFQIQLIHDLINKSDSILEMSATYVNKDTNIEDDYPATIELELEIKYSFNDRNFELILFLEGDQLDSQINLDSFRLKLFSKGGEEINIDWLEKNQNLENKLVQTLISPYL